MNKKLLLPRPVLYYILAVGALLNFALAENPALSVYALLCLGFGLSLLWRQGESAIFVTIFAVQWLQAAVKIFMANASGLPLSETSDYGGNIESAAYLSLIGLLIFAIGIRIGIGRRRRIVADEIRAQVYSLNIRRVYILYGITFGLSLAASSFYLHASGIRQLLLPISMLHWSVFFVLTFILFSSRKVEKLPWFFIFALELVFSFGSYFSSFKTVFLFALIALLGGQRRWSRRAMVLMCVIVAVGAYLVVLWTAIKGDYREYLSGGASQQIVVVPYEERVVKLFQLGVSVQSDAFGEAVHSLVRRVSYIDFFGAVINNVPSVVPHTDGELWIDAITRPFMPRLLFPDKSEIDDSKRTVEFSGVRVSGKEQGTSISLGYMAESYIDFGSPGMMIPIFFYGIMLGQIYRMFAYTGSLKGLLGMGLASVTLFGALLFESSITKVFGGLVATVLVFSVIRSVLGRDVYLWLTGSPRPVPPKQSR